MLDVLNWAKLVVKYFYANDTLIKYKGANMRFGSIRILTFAIALVLFTTTLGSPASPLIAFQEAKATAYHSWDELVAELQQVATDHKSIAKLLSIGKTWEGRDIWAVKISDNVELDEDEPAVIYNGAHHAREWLSIEVPLYIINYLTDGYETNLTLKNLVDCNEIWVVPCVNPDGRVYDGTDDPSTAKSWRKNRFPNGDGSFGVDINRNYGYKWGGAGSGGRTSAQDYRGTAPFSELETKAMRDLALREKFVFEIAYHSYGELILYPWGCTSSPVPEPDYTVFKTIANKMSELIPNNAGGGTKYTVKQSSDLYITSGGDHDWLYAEVGTFAFAIELYPKQSAAGTFYPDPAKIPIVCQDNIEAALYLAKIASNPYQVLPYHVNVTCTESYRQANPGQEVSFNISIWNNGYANDIYTISASAITGWTIAPNVSSLAINSNARAQVALNVTPDPTATSGEYEINFTARSQSNTSINASVKLTVEVSYNNDVGVESISPFKEGNEYSQGSYSIEGEAKNYGMQSQDVFNVSCKVYRVNSDYEATILNDSFEYTGTGNWNVTPASNVWKKGTPTYGITFAYSGSQCWATNLNGDYGYNEDDWLLSPNITLPSNATRINLTFWHFHKIENGYDLGWVKLKTANGTWDKIACFSGEMNVTEWRKVSLDITSYKGNTVQLGFHFTSDGIGNRAGWYLDDVEIKASLPSETELWNETKLTTTVLSQYSTELLLWSYEFTEPGKYRIKLETLLPVDEKAYNNEKSVTIIVVKGFTFYLRQSWNYISLPYSNSSITNASQLAEAIGDNCTQVSNWTGTEFRIYNRKTGANDFILEPGRGYLVYIVNGTTKFVVKGSKIVTVAVSLNRGWANIGVINASLSRASDLAASIGSCGAVACWDNALDRFITHPVGTNISNFELEVGKGYLVFMEVPKTWTQNI
ncbi:MAG: M14 family zinc carboxypeptidase [Candidatus Thermoplasmatota archaeon]|nr:M14 family zinc carboxypeptidase [Candidatus Thermoplasmatota archaeon]